MHAVLPSAGCAQDAPTTSEAESLFRRGVALGEIDRWSEAHELFRASFALVERPTTLFNIAYALFRTGRHREAVARFDELLALSDGGARSEDAQRLRAEAAALIGTLTLRLTPADASIEIDGTPVPPTEDALELAIDPGLHRIVVRAPGYEEHRLDVTVAPAERVERSVTLERPVVLPDAPSRALSDEPAFWIALIGGVVVVGAGVAIGVGIASSEASAPYGGTSGVVLEALRF
jgi:hypothetical protein